MWKRLKSISLVAIFVLLCLLASSCFASAQASTPPVVEPPSVTLTLNEYKQLQCEFSALEKGLNERENTIQRLSKLLNASGTATDESLKALREAKRQADEQAKQIAMLNSLLNKQDKELQTTKSDLKIAEQSLNELTSELKKRKAEERKNKILLAVATGAAVYFAAK